MRCSVRVRALILLTSLCVAGAFWWINRANYVLGSQGGTEGGGQLAHAVTATTPMTTHQEMTKRLSHIRSECVRHDVASLRRVWYAASNRQDKPRGCTTKLCPFLADQKHLLLMCFVQKVASSSLKELFLSLDNKTIDGSNSTAFHLLANEELFRVSASFYPEYKMRRFFKSLFVRHPFDRLVSAYADKAAPGRKERPFFYDKYFLPAMKRFRNEVSPDAIITFKEFVEYLITTQPLYYDEHWMPFWSRCDVCRTSYDFLGKLESASQDAAFLLSQLDMRDHRISISNKSNRERTEEFFSQISYPQVVELYKTYFLDFKLFDYSVEGFLPNGTNITSIDDTVQLYKLLF